MIKLLEAIFRRLPLLLVMLLVPAIIGVGIAFLFLVSYQAAATLWAIRRYEIIGATGPESNLEATPAQTQATALTELLQSRNFDISVATSTDLKTTLNLTPQQLASPKKLEDAYVADISKNVQVAARGTNLYDVTYTNSNARVAVQVVSSVIAQFQSQGQAISIVEGQHLLQADHDQLKQAEIAAKAAAQKQSAYLDSHPDATTINDPQYALLDAQRLQALATLQNLQSTVATLNQEIADQSTGGNSLFKTLDSPVIPDPSSRSKVVSTTGGIGAAVGLVACVLYLLIIVRRDRALYSALDVQKATSAIGSFAITPMARDF